MEFAILSLSDVQVNPTTGRRHSALDRVNETIGHAMLADRLGLDLFALGEHHSPEFAVPSPAVVLAAIAARTQRIRLTSATTVLSVLDPVRVYEDFAQLDLVSNGRAEIIAGRSAFLEPFPLFGDSLQDYDDLFSEKLDLLLQICARERVTWSGRFRPRLVDAPIAPRAVQQPLPVWVGVGGTPQSAQRAGRLGLPMVLGLIGGTFAQARRTIEIYRDASARAGHADSVLNVGISTHFFAASDNGPAVRELHPYYHEYLRPKTPGGRGWEVDLPSFEHGTRPGMALMVGNTEQLVEKILDAHSTLGISRFIGQVDWGGLPPAMVEESIQRFATEIVPQVRAALVKE